MLNYNLVGAGGTTGGIARFRVSRPAVNCLSRSLTWGAPFASITIAEQSKN